MRYDRKIKYLDYLENGERVRGSGFLKMEINDDSFKMELTVKGVRGAKEFVGDVILCGGGREEILEKIRIENGQGELRHTCHIDAGIGSTGIGCDELSGIRIPLGEGREIACTWNTAEPLEKTPAEPPERATAQSSAEAPAKISAKLMTQPPIEQEGTILFPEQTLQTRERAMQSGEQTMPLPERRERKEKPRERASQLQERKETVRDTAMQEAPKGKRGVSGEQAAPLREQIASLTGRTVQQQPTELKSRKQPEQQPTELKSRKQPEQQPETVPLLESKWLQLCAIYPHIRPFQDQREYLSIGPEDFVLFSSDSYKAASNSFMLHGYYNYRHLILTREERRGELLYYVGVPGNYYDREKQVAIMFGFESFECAQEPAQSADFGYYMMRVQL